MNKLCKCGICNWKGRTGQLLVRFREKYSNSKELNWYLICPNCEREEFINYE